MTKTKTNHRCSSCGTSSPQWAGRCGGCGEWNTLELDAPVVVSRVGGPRKASSAVLLSGVDSKSSPVRPTHIPELDRVLGGGVYSGSVTLIGGEPGIGKSTLVLQLCAALALTGSRCLMVTGEESVQQVRRRAERLNACVDDVLLLAETEVESVLASVNEIKPDVLIIDSVQTMSSSAIGSAAGTVTQVRECSQAFVTLAKQGNVIVILIGHVTKDGTLAGPRVLEHMVDTVLEFEGDRHHGLRFLRAAKHRFGATDEVGVLEMAEEGLRSVPDASGLFLNDRRPGVAGSVVVPILHGRRPLLVELQGLVSSTRAPQPRRVAQGLDGGRFAVVLAVLERRAGVSVGDRDVYASIVGGAKVDDPGSDLPLALALVSSLNGSPLGDDLVAVGEIGLGGEVRNVTHLSKRLTEARRMGFRAAIVPRGAPDGPEGLRLHRVATLREAIAVSGAGATTSVAPATSAPDAVDPFL